MALCRHHAPWTYYESSTDQLTLQFGFLLQTAPSCIPRYRTCNRNQSTELCPYCMTKIYITLAQIATEILWLSAKLTDVILAVSHNHTILSSQLRVAIFRIAHKTRFHLRIFYAAPGLFRPLLSLPVSSGLSSSSQPQTTLSRWTTGQVDKLFSPRQSILIPSSYIGSLHHSAPSHLLPFLSQNMKNIRIFPPLGVDLFRIRR